MKQLLEKNPVHQAHRSFYRRKYFLVATLVPAGVYRDEASTRAFYRQKEQARIARHTEFERLYMGRLE